MNSYAPEHPNRPQVKQEKGRTLTNLYNALVALRENDTKAKPVVSAKEFVLRLDARHNALDTAVCAAYGRDASILSDEEAILSKLLDLNLARAGQG